MVSSTDPTNAGQADNARVVEDPNCPRCGYELRGVVESWHENCLLEGTCSECGLGFHWHNILRPHLDPPRWCVEYSHGAMALPRGSVRTMLMSLRPWRFWSRLQMHHPIRAPRIIMYTIVLFAMMLVAYIIEHGTLALSARNQMQVSAAAAGSMLPSVIAQQQAALQRMQTDPSFSAGMDEQTRANIIAAMQQQLAMFQTNAGQSGQPVPFFSPLVDALLRPFSSFSSVNYAAPLGGGYPAPNTLYNLMGSGTVSMVDSLQVAFFGLAFGASFGATVLIGVPIGFILLPVSRRKAKVRWAHIARICAYSLVIPAVSIAIAGLLLALGHILDGSIDLPYWAAGIVALVGGIVFPAAWWILAIWKYLRIPHAWAIVPMLTIVFGLIATVIITKAMGVI